VDKSDKLEEGIMQFITRLFEAHDLHDICNLPGAAVIKIDDTWCVAANGHKEEIKVKPEGMMSIKIPPFHFAVWYHGWFAGLLHPYYGGPFAAGSEANEESFKTAVSAHITEMNNQKKGD
jgi:hypothetical protein